MAVVMRRHRLNRWREAVWEDFFPKEKVEVEEMRRRQARKAREKEARQEEGDGRDEHEGEEVRMDSEEEEKSMSDRKAYGVAIDRGKECLCVCPFLRLAGRRRYVAAHIWGYLLKKSNLSLRKG